MVYLSGSFNTTYSLFKQVKQYKLIDGQGYQQFLLFTFKCLIFISLNC